MHEAMLSDSSVTGAPDVTAATERKLNLSPAVCDSIAGALAGAFSVLVSQPLDTVRVRMQQQHGHGCNGTVAALRDMVKREGVLSPWKGLSYPLAFSALQSALMFQAYGVALRYLSAHSEATPAMANLQSHHTTHAQASSSSSPHSLANASSTGLSSQQRVQPVDTALRIQHSTIPAAVDNDSNVRPWYSLFGFAGSHADTVGRGSSSSGDSIDSNGVGPSDICAHSSSSSANSQVASCYQLASVHEVDVHQASTHGSQIPLAWHGFLAGVFAGLAQVFLWSPVELLKLRVQLQSALPGASQYIKPLQMARQVLQSEGWRGLYRGFTITVIRDLPSFGLYFWTYHILCGHLEPKVHPEQATAITQAVAGAGAGILAWLPIYPLDVVKSRMQAISAAASPPGATWITFASQTYRQGGVRSFGRGLAPTLARAALMDAALFMSYSRVLNGLHEL